MYDYDLVTMMMVMNDDDDTIPYTIYTILYYIHNLSIGMLGKLSTIPG